MKKPRDVRLEPRASLRDVLVGKARVVGARTHVGRHDLNLPSGFISPYEIREALGLRYGDPPIEEARYERSRSRASDAGIVARFVLTRALGHLRGRGTRDMDEERPFIVSSHVDPLDTHAAVEKIIELLKTGEGGLVFFVHPHALNLADENPELKAQLARAKLVLPDGVGIRVAAAILGVPLPANVNGTDLIPELLLEMSAHGYPLALIGGKPGIADKAAQVWQKQTRVKLAGVWHGYQQDDDAYERIAEQVEHSAPCVVLLAFGSPLQERFAVEHFAERKGVVAITVGGLFDFTAGAQPRAPMAWRELGLEWVWRLVHEPKRLGKRYLVGNPSFVARAIRQAMK